jgi:HK97 family phage major capsid protein
MQGEGEVIGTADALAIADVTPRAWTQMVNRGEYVAAPAARGGNRAWKSTHCTTPLVVSFGMIVWPCNPSSVCTPSAGNTDAARNSPTESEALWTNITLTPHTAAAAMGYSRRTLISATPSIDALLRDDMAKQIAFALDQSAIFGIGGLQPLGLLNYVSPSLPTLPEGAITIEGLIDLMSLPQAANGMTGAPAWLTNIKCVGAMMKIKTSGSGEYVLLPTLPGNLLGFPMLVSSVIPSTLHVSGPSTDNPLIFGAWNSMLVGRWSGIDILADPYTRGSSGAVRLYAFLDVDIGIRHIESFAAMLVLTAS